MTCCFPCLYFFFGLVLFVPVLHQRTRVLQINRVAHPKLHFFSLPVSFNKCYCCSKEPSHRDGSFEYQSIYVLDEKY